jgi:hypothetical protein
MRKIDYVQQFQIAKAVYLDGKTREEVAESIGCSTKCVRACCRDFRGAFRDVIIFNWEKRNRAMERAIQPILDGEPICRTSKAAGISAATLRKHVQHYAMYGYCYEKPEFSQLELEEEQYYEIESKLQEMAERKEAIVQMPVFAIRSRITGRFVATPDGNRIRLFQSAGQAKRFLKKHKLKEEAFTTLRYGTICNREWRML